ncbi:MAG: ABC transporter permease [Victivallales bacterium]|nr:ABC transporter permease [Victivallales bacterium]
MSIATSTWENPILRREFTSAARSTKTISMAAAATFALSFIIYFLWPRTGIFSDSNSTELFTIFLGAELTFMLLMTAGFTASSITYERERKTFAMLQTSLLTPGEILFGKLIGTLGISLVLFLVTVPVASLCALSGGISLPTLLKALSIVAIATIVFGLMGLAISALCNRTYVSLLLTYIGIAVLAGATWLPYALFDIPSLKPLFIKLRAISPYEALFALQFSEAYEIDVAGANAAAVFHTFLIAMLIIGGLSFCIFAKFIFAPPNFKRTRTVEQYTDTKTMLKRKLGFPFYLIDPLRRKKPIANYRNPVFVAEIRSKIFGNPKFIIRSLTTCICISLCLLVAILQQIGNTDLDKIRAVAIIFQLGLVALLAPTVSSGSVTDELSNNTFLLLRLSPLSSFTVVMGKIKAALMYVMIFLLSSLPVLIVLVFLETNDSPDFGAMFPRTFNEQTMHDMGLAWENFFQIYSRVFSWCAILLTTCLLLTSAGLCASCFCPNTGVATAVSYGFALVTMAGSLAILLFGSRTSPEMQACFLMFNPFLAALEITLDSSLASRLPLIWGNHLWVNHLYLACGITFLLLLVSAIRVHFLFREQK